MLNKVKYKRGNVTHYPLIKLRNWCNNLRYKLSRLIYGEPYMPVMVIKGNIVKSRNGTYKQL